MARAHHKSEALINVLVFSIFSIYIMGLVFQWKKKHGGVLQMENNAKAKSSMVYDLIDNSSGFYRLVHYRGISAHL